jgi:hypothetical protein
MTTATCLGDLSLEAAAQEVVGNWQGFDSFCWHDRPDDCEQFAIVYTHNRDSSVLAESNAHVISEALAPYTEGDDPDVYPEHHGHWACGWVDGFSIRVYRDDRITDAFCAYHALAARLADYAVLDEEDYSTRELEAIDESWDNWARREFECALEDKFADCAEFEFPDGDALRTFFNEKADQANVSWEPEGSGYSIRIGRIVEGIDLDDLADYTLCYVVSYVDVGEEKEEYTSESEARERVDTLRAAGFSGASYIIVTPVESVKG